jgi:hypothetical protein
MSTVNIARMILSDDLHAENDDERGACPTGITHYLGKSKSHSTSREKGNQR